MGNLSAYYHRFWESSTLMTWLSNLVRALNVFAVLPLLLKQFSPAEISLWYLFSSIIVLLSLADMGFRQTFVRIISYAVAGVDKIGIYQGVTNAGFRTTNWKFIEEIVSSMKIIYKYLTILLLILLLTVGTMSLCKPVSFVQDKTSAWIAWAVIIAANVIRFYGTIYQNYIEGFNKIALVRKVESLMTLGSIITSIVVLVLNGGLLALVIANQIWLVLNTGRNWYLSRVIENGNIKHFGNLGFDKEFFKQIWQPAWRTGVSGLMSNVLIQLSGLLYAQISRPEVVAPYLLALRIMIQIINVSMAPFYSKIPYLSQLRAEGKIKDLMSVSQRGMFLSHLVFVLGISTVGVFSDYLLRLTNSNVEFVSPVLWIVMSVAFWVHRYGAMHMQLYLTTNHVVAHIADGVSGIIFMVFAFATVHWFGLYAIPLGMLAGYLGFYSWYAAMHSYKSISSSFFDYEKKTTLLPLSIFIVVCTIILCFKVKH